MFFFQCDLLPNTTTSAKLPEEILEILEKELSKLENERPQNKSELTDLLDKLSKLCHFGNDVFKNGKLHQLISQCLTFYQHKLNINHD